MRLEFTNQRGTLDFNVQKKCPLKYTETENGMRVDEFYINPVEGQLDISVDEIIIDTGNLPIADVFDVIRNINELDGIRDKKRHIECRKSRANYAAGYDDNGKPYAIELHKNTKITH